MGALKTMLVIALGMGSTWGAWQISPGGSSAMLAVAAAADEAAPGNSEVADDAMDDAMDDAVSDAEIQKQLERINAVLEEKGEVEGFTPSEPLPADLKIDMSSEI